MKKINPELTQQFLKEIKNQSSRIVTVDGVQIRTSKNVFPPYSNFSHSSEELHTVFGNLHGLRVLDIGTGTGIQAIRAVKDGARQVLALDNSPAAVSCARENTVLNGVDDRVTVIESDLFKNIKNEGRFDLIIANLPIVDFPIYGIVESALYDPGHELHRRFLAQAKAYLTQDGVVVMTHVNFRGEGDFAELEAMFSEFGFSVEGLIEIEDIGYKWRMYRIKSIG